MPEMIHYLPAFGAFRDADHDEFSKLIRDLIRIDGYDA